MSQSDGRPKRGLCGAERLNSGLRSFLERAELCAGTSAARADCLSADGLTAGTAEEARCSNGSVGGSGRHGGAHSGADTEARLLRGLRSDVVRAVNDGVLSSADPALLMRLLPALHAYIEAGRHVTLSYDEVRKLPMMPMPASDCLTS